MQERVAELESSVASLQAELTGLRMRVAALEAGSAISARPNLAVTAIPDVDAAQVEGWLALAGRTLVILGGAYLLRAITAAHIVPYGWGVAAGLLYGAPWLLLASRAGSRGRLLDAFCYGLSTALIGYPLVWEATVRFGVFTPLQSAVLVGALTAAAYALSFVWRLHSLAAIVTCGALASALGLAIETGAWVAFTTLALAAGLATLWLGYLRDWVLLRWPAALLVDLLVVVLTGRATGQFWAALAVQVLVVAGYLGSFAARTLRKGRRVIPFEVAQSIGILAVVLPCLFGFVAARPAGVLTAAAVLLACGVAIYAVSFTMVARRAPIENLFFYSLLAMALTAVGVAIALPAMAGIVFALAGVAAAAGARRLVAVVLWTQAALFLTAAAIASGALAAATAALVAPASTWLAPGAAAWTAVACAGGALLIPPQRVGPLRYGIAAARLGLAVLVSWSVSGALVYVLGSAFGAMPGWGPAWLAALRTMIAVAVTLALAYASRRDAWREAGWLTYPMLVIVGAKLLTSDVPSGHPLTLFLALAAYGIALIAAPRARRSRPRPA
jgi:hypothetical protein